MYNLLGRGANIGACSMVLQDVPAYSVAVGVPARVIVRKVSDDILPAPAFSMEQPYLFMDYQI